jgi:hypothetical protein
MRLPRSAAAMLPVLAGFISQSGAVTIPVTTKVQKVSSTGGCSLQEAIYSANLHTNAAVDLVSADGAVLGFEGEHSNCRRERAISHCLRDFQLGGLLPSSRGRLKQG